MKVDLRSYLGVDNFLELVKDHECCKSGAISFEQYLYTLETEIKLLKEQSQRREEIIKKAIKKVKIVKEYKFDLIGRKEILSILEEDNECHLGLKEKTLICNNCLKKETCTK